MSIRSETNFGTLSMTLDKFDVFVKLFNYSNYILCHPEQLKLKGGKPVAVRYYKKQKCEGRVLVVIQYPV